MLRFLDAGESHGRCYVGIIDGIPAGVEIEMENINRLLKERQRVYGRGGRMEIENDEAIILSGLRGRMTTGGPIGLMIENRDYENWKDFMSPIDGIKGKGGVTVPRPGHADLPGILKFGFNDARNILERASARQTVIRTAIGGIAMEFLRQFDIEVKSHVCSIGGIVSKPNGKDKSFWINVENSLLRCGDKEAEEKMRAEIDKAKAMGDTVGGIVEIIVERVPAGIGSHTTWDKRLDTRLAAACMSVQSVKGVEIGMGFKTAERYGSEVHDEIFYGENGFYRKTNNAGGIEGGISNGEDIIVRCALKPIPTLLKPLNSVDIRSKMSAKAHVERSDVCAVPAASVVLKAVVAWEIAVAFLDKFCGDNIDEVKNAYEHYIKRLNFG
jgi:chorismate synthase (EC 4.2.3.5)